MAYLGNSFPDRSTGVRPRDDFIGDGVQQTFLLSQPVPGSFENNISVLIDNVNQQPEEAYFIVPIKRIRYNNQVDEFYKNRVVTQTNGASGIIVNYRPNTGYIDVYQTTSTDFVSSGSPQFTQQNPEGTVSTAFATSIQTLYGQGLRFTGVPDVGQIIYATHIGGQTYQVQPAAGSVVPESLSDNIRNFVIDKFTANASQDEFALSQVETSANTLLVHVDGALLTPVDDFVLSNSGASITLTTPLSGGEKVVITHLSFSTVSRTLIDEVGSFVPIFEIGGAGVDLNFTSKIGAYNKFGRQVTCNISFRLIQAGSSTGVLTIRGLPYESYGVSQQAFTFYMDEVDGFTGVPTCRLLPESTSLQLGYLDPNSGRWLPFDHTLLTNSSFFTFTFTYMSAK